MGRAQAEAGAVEDMVKTNTLQNILLILIGITLWSAGDTVYNFRYLEYAKNIRLQEALPGMMETDFMISLFLWLLGLLCIITGVLFLMQKWFKRGRHV